jgi:hypothetical protein
VRTEIQGESFLLLSNGAPAQVLGLFEESDFPARLGQGVRGSETGEASADDDVGFHVVLC